MSVPVTLEFKAENLPDKDLLSKSDPMCVVYKISPKEKGFSSFKPTAGNFVAQEVFRTCVKKNSLNPHWENVYATDYVFEQEQWFFFQVVDVDEKHNANISAQDFLGGVMVTLGNIVAASMIYIKPTQMPRTSTEYAIQCRFTLASTRLFKSDTPFIQVRNSQGQTVKETIKGNGKVSTYEEFTLSGMHTTPSSTWHLAHTHNGDEIGDVVLTEQQLSNMPPGSSIPVLHKGKEAGMLTFLKCERRERQEEVKNSIINYLDTGKTISAIVAIDFTQSNGEPSSPGSLHYLKGNNQYRNGINSIVPIIDQYDKDKTYPVFGYGISIRGVTDHCRLLTETAQYSDGVVMAYEKALSDPENALSGPTNFAPVIRESMRRASSQENVYTVLVIFTDGVISDMDNTISAIVDASYLPMSIIIIGVGNADFQSMCRLDNDGQPPLRSGNKVAKRDIVQFVPLRDYKDAQSLQAATLAELPKQISGL